MPKAESGFPMIMLLGRRDEPTDAVRDYANCLTDALRRQGIVCESSEIQWEESGWFAALIKLWRGSRAWRSRWVVLDYTGLMWSRRGFPLTVPLVLKILKLRKCRTAIVFHDVHAVPGPRWVDRFRVFFQERTMRHLSVNACRTIIPVPMEGISWLPLQKSLIEFIPVAANIPSLDKLARVGFVPVPSAIPMIAVLGIPPSPSPH